MKLVIIFRQDWMNSNNMKVINYNLIFLSLSFLLGGCLGNIPTKAGNSAIEYSPPLWVVSKKESRYPDALYITGVGESKESSSIADDIARAELLKQIKVEIESRDTAYYSETSSNTGEFSNQEVFTDSRITTKTKGTVSGIKITERWFDKKSGRYFSFAVLDKNILTATLKEKINEDLNLIKNLFSSGQAYEGRKEGMKALKIYKQAFNRREALNPAIENYYLIAGRGGERIEKGLRLSQIEDRINRLSAKADPESYSWNEAVERLAEQVVSGIQDENTVTLFVHDFIEAGSEQTVTLSKMLTSSLKTVLTRADALQVVESEGKPDYYLAGLFWLDGNGILKVNARLVDNRNKTLVATGRVNIKDSGIKKEVLNPKNEDSENLPDAETVYNILLEKLYYSDAADSHDLTVDLWTDKNEASIGETLTLYFKSSRDSYVYLLDIGTGGTLTLLFPNSFQQDNFARAGITYSVPDGSGRFSIDISGPAGVERVKVIASIKPLNGITPKRLDGFYSIDKDSQKMRNLSIKFNALAASPSSWAEDRLEILITENSSARKKRIRSIYDEKPEKPKKPIDFIGSSGHRLRSIHDEKLEEPEKPIDITGTPGLK